MAGSPIDDIAGRAGRPQDAPDLRAPAEPGGGDSYDVIGLGENCPVQPLGFLSQRNYFLDFAGQLIELGTEFRKGEVMMLFGTRQPWLEARWPTKKEVTDKATGQKEWIITGFDQKEVQKALIVACSRSGMFDPTGKVRGRGAHRGADGELVMHCGSQVLVGGKRGTRNNILKPSTHSPGLLAGYVYPTAPALTLPDEIAAPDHVGQQILALLETWNWKDRAIAPYLLFCWLPAMMLGGALRNRPHMWITGPSGAGKTTLQQFLRQIADDWAIATEDATEAGVRQLLNQDTLAVMFDEIEPDEGNADVHMKIVKLARLAYSGGGSLRGGQDHKSKQFVARSCFLFSSIHHHELPAQDRNRMAILHLSPFPSDTQPLMLPDTVKAWGSQLRRRLVQQWHRFDATLAAYQREMLKQGYTGREQDTYGTLLACGDLLLYSDVPDPTAMHEPDRCGDVVRRLVGVLDLARSEAEDTTERCLRHLAGYRLPAKAGEQQEGVGRWIRRAMIEVHNQNGDAAPRNKLRTHGMRLVNLRPEHKEGNGQGGLIDAVKPEGVYLVVASKTNVSMLEVFEKSLWRKGVWMQALALVVGAVTNKKSRFDGPAESCILVPIGEVIDLEATKIEAAVIRQSQANRA